VKRKLSPPPPFLRRTVYCLLCDHPATLKPTNTLNMMLRCDRCRVLVFANGELSRERLSRLPDCIYEFNATNFGLFV